MVYIPLKKPKKQVKYAYKVKIIFEKIVIVKEKYVDNLN